MTACLFEPACEILRELVTSGVVSHGVQCWIEALEAIASAESHWLDAAGMALMREASLKFMRTRMLPDPRCRSSADQS